MTTLQYADKLSKLQRLLQSFDFEVKSNQIILGDMIISQDDDFLDICINKELIVHFITVKSAYEFIYYN